MVCFLVLYLLLIRFAFSNMCCISKIYDETSAIMMLTVSPPPDLVVVIRAACADILTEYIGPNGVQCAVDKI